MDTSILAAILFRESGDVSFLDVLMGERTLSMSAGSWLELTVVLARRGRPELLPPAEQLRLAVGIRIAPVSVDQIEIARTAYLRFGRGSRHPADLNFGDCFTYALARETGEPLLFKGNDFSHTDLVLAETSPYPR